MPTFLHQGFTGITSIVVGKTIHALAIRRFFNLPMFQSNTLIDLYCKCGSLSYAQKVFDLMPQRNEATWNTLMSGYVRCDRVWEAIEIFCLMQANGLRMNGFVLASILTACSKLSLGDHGLQLHSLVVKSGLLDDVFVSTALLHLYATCCTSVLVARQVFDEMCHRNVVSWTAMMVACARHNVPDQEIELYQKMRLQGVGANQGAFATVISSCGTLGNMFLGEQVIGHAVTAGFGSDVSVCNAMIAMYGNLGSIEDAHLVFDHMPERDVITWNSLLSAYAQNGMCNECLLSFSEMRLTNAIPNSTTISSVLTACSSGLANLKWGMGTHGLAIKVGLDFKVSVGNALLTMYSGSGSPSESKLIFVLMPERDLISWNCMITCYVQNHQFDDALVFFSEMLRAQRRMNYVTFINVLSACSNPDYLAGGEIIHSLLICAGLQDNILLGNALVTMYGKCGATKEASNVLLAMEEPNTISWNAMIGGHAENEETEEAIKIFNMMRKNGGQSNYITLVNVLSACLQKEHLLMWGFSIHALVLFSGFEIDEFVKNALITMYARCGGLEVSNILFNESASNDIVSWNAVIAANARHGHGEDALKLFMQMHHAGLKLDRFSFSGGLAGSASLALVEVGQQIHDIIVKLGFESDQHVVAAVVDMYGKCGEIDDAVKAFERTNNRCPLMWNTLISCYARHGYAGKARKAFQEMLQIGVKPDYVTFISLLSACNHVGLVDEGLQYFSLMTEEMGIAPVMEHHVCMVDLLGRAGRLYDAERFISEMLVPPDIQIWRSLLASCRIHGNLEIGTRAAKRLLELDPLDDSAHVLLSNMYAAKGRWQHVENVRNHMKFNKIKKIPSCSWIKVKNKVNSFGTGDWTHPQAKQIYAKLGTLLDLVKGVGYIANTSFVLHDMDKEQKEQNLWHHSEKLALAFGLSNSPAGSTLRIFKNLRVCGDCHTVFKLVSQVTGSRIVLRDMYRFHHFKDGECSCSDYW
ncbi:Pentatricopeptide repeat-containing protein [Nymphaea thermarum]|nr:Pentatricopeptide repeat-containing protein [Nymphaea thermarum]